MKKLIVILCLSAQSTIAGLIDLGGWNWSTVTGFPAPLDNLFSLEGRHRIFFFDEARVIPSIGTDGQIHQWHGWVSLYGVLNGGTLFTTDLIENDPTPNAIVSWDFADTGYAMRWLDIFGTDADGNAWEHIYRVNGHRAINQFSGNLALNGEVNIGSIAFYGATPGLSVPDTTNPLALLVIALFLLGIAKRLNEQKTCSTIQSHS
jgi:hypothetical protein